MRPPDSPKQDAMESVEHDRASHAGFDLENLFEVSPDAIFVTDSRGVIRAANPRAVELFGHTEDELIGQPIEFLIPSRYHSTHPAHRENFEAHPRARQMGASLNLFGLRKDLSEFPVDIMLKPIETPGGRVTLSFVRDVSEQKAALEASQRLDLQLRSIVDGVRDHAIYLLDADGNVTTWNPGAARIKGYSADEILGLHFSRFFTQPDIDRGRPTELLRLAAERGRIEEEGWRVRKDGSRFWANIVVSSVRDSTGAVTGYVKVTRDFTDRKRAEEAVMLQLSTALMTNLDIGKLLAAISASIHEVVPHDMAAVALFDASTGDLAVQFLGPEEPAIFSTDGHTPIEGTISGQVFRSGEPVLLQRLSDADYAPETAKSLARLEMQSGCWVPLLHHGNAIGALGVLSRLEGGFSQEDVSILARIAIQVAMAMDNAIAFRHMSELRDKLRQEKRYLELEISLDHNFEDIVGESAGLKNVLRQIETVAPTTATVLIQGETGTGKELLARAIHRLSPRKDSTFIKLNCAAIPAGLVESELFGHEKGAFTGAIARKIGRLELANGGTLFLDEVGELPLDLQPKLLRALQEREIERIGGTRGIPVDIRLIAATNRDLATMVQEKQFRSDLYYRLKVFPVFSPPLREREADIPVLVRHFVDTHSRRMGKVIESIPEATMKALMRWPWPGNIRELENFLERAVILTRGPVLYAPLAELETAESMPAAQETESPTLEAAEREHILRVLREAAGQIGGDDGAAARLGLKRTTLNSKLKKLGIERSDYMKSQ